MSNPIGTDINILDNNLTQIFRDSDEWLTLEYFLQVNARTSRVKLVQAWHVSPVQVINKFQKKNSEKLVLKTFIDTSALDRDNTIQDICARGFCISSKGLKLSIGNFNIPGFPLTSLNKNKTFNKCNELTYENDPQNSRKKKLKKIIEHSQNSLLSGERGIFEFLLCDVGVGLSLSVNEKDVCTYNRDVLPIEYDSIFIKKQKEESLDDALTIHYKNKENENHKHNNEYHNVNNNEINLALGGDIMPTYGVLPYYTFHHEYVIYDNSQILPRYLIQFECDPNDDEHFSLPLCDYCSDAPSIFYCESDEVKLCEKCDTLIHSQNKIVKKHIRKALNEAQKIPGKCKKHMSNDINMFCTICHIPICNLCISNHVHTDLTTNQNFPYFKNGNNNQDTIISLNMAYKAILHHSNNPSNFIKQKKKNLNDLLAKIDTLHEQVRINMNDAEKSVYTILEDLVKQLHIITDQKMCSVLSEEYELKRQFNEIIWNESFLYYLQTILPPADFMNAWLKHCQCREQIENNSKVVEELHSLIFPDMRIKGNINIVTESSMEHDKIYHPNDKL
ncbi:zinc finger protein, putative [Plasmodium sp. gorilla clade G3]|nr:zinc finger protein, putative [Plasmodium sp. gorilla clade G3]